MTYFDRGTPLIVVPDHPTDHPGHVHPDRYRADGFPETVNARDLDQHLLSLWGSAGKGDTFLRFIQYFQILEYAAFY